VRRCLRLLQPIQLASQIPNNSLPVIERSNNAHDHPRLTCLFQIITRGDFHEKKFIGTDAG
jgi:hypothetical protein